MAKFASDGMIEGGLNKFLECTVLTLCEGQPTSIANITERKLAASVIDSSAFVIADGDVSGRKATVSAQSGLSITSEGVADHVAVDNGTDFYVSTIETPHQTLYVGGTVGTTEFAREITDPE